jgi:hypothetical protein
MPILAEEMFKKGNVAHQSRYYRDGCAFFVTFFAQAKKVDCGQGKGVSEGVI